MLLSEQTMLEVHQNHCFWCRELCYPVLRSTLEDIQLSNNLTREEMWFLTTDSIVWQVFINPVNNETLIIDYTVSCFLYHLTWNIYFFHYHDMKGGIYE